VFGNTVGSNLHCVLFPIPNNNHPLDSNVRLPRRRLGRRQHRIRTAAKLYRRIQTPANLAVMAIGDGRLRICILGRRIERVTLHVRIAATTSRLPCHETRCCVHVQRVLSVQRALVDGR